jgi:hypothetical protein
MNHKEIYTELNAHMEIFLPLWFARLIDGVDWRFAVEDNRMGMIVC